MTFFYLKHGNNASSNDTDLKGKLNLTSFHGLKFVKTHFKINVALSTSSSHSLPLECKSEVT